MLEPKSNPTGLHLFILPTWRNAASPSPSDKREPGRQSTGFLVEYLGFSAPLQPRLFSGPTAEVVHLSPPRPPHLL
ncbi:60S ribosomal protein [Musa troglodytarum]|uniref:60S ribosomal protein n=1 Tax=Musa troglodytarum TaxID=320322 RepID=A0A9E7KMZ5_9LILI|nr:60S ribosomal protein [Musa troglodytarum]